MNRSKKVNSKNLRAFILREARKLQKEAAKKGEVRTDAEAKEYKAGEEADTIANDIDFIKALNIHERKTLKKLKKIREHKKRLRFNLLKKLK